MLKMKLEQMKWRARNKHNYTRLNNITRLKNISIGKDTYGPINIISYDNEYEELVIGNYVSIAKEVIFITGGEHYYQGLTSYPLKVMKFNYSHEATTKGPIIVEDGVWIGYGSVILSGVTLSKGTIIAAGSVVSKSTDPFCIYGGNPAKKIKHIYPEKLENLLCSHDLTSLIDKIDINDYSMNYEPLTESALIKLIEKE